MNADNENTGERGTQKCIEQWLLPCNLFEAAGKSRSEIFTVFGNEYEPVGKIPACYLKYLGDEVKDTAVYSGKGYFIDHCVNHHPEIETAEYAKIHDILSNSDYVKLDDRKPERTSLAFIKRYEKYNTVVVSVDNTNEKKIIVYKTFFGKKTAPYANLRSIQGD